MALKPLDRRYWWTADQVIAELEGPPRPLTRIKDAHVLVDRLSREYLDQLLHVTYRHINEEHAPDEPQARGQVLNACTDEAAVAIFLAARRFYAQANAHSRSLLERRDLARLFRVDPTAAALWADHGNRDRWRKLNPSGVRKRLGDDGRQERIYRHLSEHGAHPTAPGVLLNSAVELVENDAVNAGTKRLQVTAGCAGSVNVGEAARCLASLLIATGTTAAEAMEGCGLCASPKTIRRFRRAYALSLRRLADRHLRPLFIKTDAEKELAKALYDAAKLALHS